MGEPKDPQDGSHRIPMGTLGGLWTLPEDPLGPIGGPLDPPWGPIGGAPGDPMGPIVEQPIVEQPWSTPGIPGVINEPRTTH